jgi:nitroimidazol reductase NimA-like FMN-containing flavoprotein (pyridoxamine 5'-phosphate oxidase superfamily)
VRRHPDRARYETEIIDAILDEGLICHVGFASPEGPVVIPTAYARVGDALYLHGALANAALRAASDGSPICVTVTLLDGLVLARSAFHHSINYRSVVIFGVGVDVEGDDEKRAALEAIVEHLVPGRSNDARGPSPAELRATRVVRIPLAEASAKVRTGGPVDEEDDLSLPIWAGTIPLRTTPQHPIADELVSGVGEPAYVTGYRRPGW